MKKLTVKKGSECMACLGCEIACSEAFYKEFDPAKSCIQIGEKKGNGKACGMCAVWKVCEGLRTWCDQAECQGCLHD